MPKLKAALANLAGQLLCPICRAGGWALQRRFATGEWTHTRTAGTLFQSTICRAHAWRERLGQRQ